MNRHSNGYLKEVFESWDATCQLHQAITSLETVRAVWSDSIILGRDYCFRSMSTISLRHNTVYKIARMLWRPRQPTRANRWPARRVRCFFVDQLLWWPRTWLPNFGLRNLEIGNVRLRFIFVINRLLIFRLNDTNNTLQGNGLKPVSGDTFWLRTPLSVLSSTET